MDGSSIHSYLSFRPLLAVLKKNIAEGHPGMQKLYGEVVQAFESHPELLETITDLSVLQQHSQLIEELLSSVFPPTTANYMYGVSIPFQFKAVYTSPLFRTILLKPGSNDINMPNEITGEKLSREKMRYACGLILKKYLGYNNPENTKSVYPFADPGTGLTRYVELRLDGRFIDVNPIGEMPALPESLLDPQTNRLFTIEELIEKIPVGKFVFEGITPIRVNDVTETAILGDIGSRLLGINAIPEPADFIILQTAIRNLIGIRDLSIGITPFFRVNDHYIYSDPDNESSLLFKNMLSATEKDEISDYCKLLFRDNSLPLLYESLDEKTAGDVQCLQYYYRQGARSLILCPLIQKENLMGILEIMSTKPGQLTPAHVGRVEATLPLFTLGLEKTLEQLNNRIERVIKNKFTAVQPAVEWKFTEAALKYIVRQPAQEDVKIDRIAFADVYPLFGSIDVRSSSIARSHAIQLDILEQLELAKKLVINAQLTLSFPLLQEIEFKIDRHIYAATDILQAEEELGIQEFFQNQVAGVFKHLQATEPSLKNELEEYFSALHPALGMIYHHRKEYEESISLINDIVSRFIDKEQAAAQKVYPHYFDRYVTDGVEFNIYIGQSISPRKKFDEIYLRNMKMWQLTVLAKAARKTHQLEKELPNILRTTQLILSHSQPLAISFRSEERKFDVDGAYNTRYEIVKKRIDKVRIKSSNERLTQPGKIAIVYSQSKDAAEYTEYIEFLQNKNLLKPGIEKHDLEELQGVIGLKALRVEINFEDGAVAEKKVELSGTTSRQLLE